MPAKKPAKSKSQQSATRGRSKSVGRSASVSRSRTPSRSRSRSRSRVKTTTKRSRTPASESKMRRRSSSSSSSSPERQRPSNSRSRPAAVEKRTQQSTVREATPTRVSQRIIHKLESKSRAVSVRSSSPVVRPEKPGFGTKLFQKISVFIEEKVFPPTIRSLFSLILIPFFVYWMVFLVFIPAPIQAASNGKAIHTIWGPALPFAGVLWPTDWRVYFDYRCHAFMLAYFFIHFLAARFLPAGLPSESGIEARRTGYKSNGLFTLLLFVILYAVFQFGKITQLHGFKPSLLIPKYWLGLLSASCNIGTLFAIAAFIASRRLPRSQCSPKGNTGNVLVDFLHGRSLRPRWFGLDWKIVFHRPSIFGMLFLEATCLCAQFERYGRVSPALVLLVLLHTIWLIESAVFERTLLSSFEARHEGFGFRMIVTALLFPFVYGLTAVYLTANPDVGQLYAAGGRPLYAHWALHGSAVLIFLLGLWINRSSANQKFLFRSQPNHPEFANLDKVSGPGTQSLLAGGWWGLVRHPNYTGIIMMALATSLPAGFASPLPWLYPIVVVLLLLCRIRETEQFNDEKYGISWTMYTKVVPYKLIPRIY